MGPIGQSVRPSVRPSPLRLPLHVPSMSTCPGAGAPEARMRFQSKFGVVQAWSADAAQGLPLYRSSSVNVDMQSSVPGCVGDSRRGLGDRHAAFGSGMRTAISAWGGGESWRCRPQLLAVVPCQRAMVVGSARLEAVFVCASSPKYPFRMWRGLLALWAYLASAYLRSCILLARARATFLSLSSVGASGVSPLASA